MNDFKTILQASLQLPGAVIIGYNKALPGIEGDVDFYEIGVQQAVGKAPKRFLNICVQSNVVVMLYFKHDPETIADVYKQHNCIIPSEVAAAHWSKIDYPNTLTADEINAHIIKSYLLICATLPKKRQTELAQMATAANAYLLFKEKAEALVASHSSMEWHYNHMAFCTPTLTVDNKPMAYFYNNVVGVKADNCAQRNTGEVDWINTLR